METLGSLVDKLSIANLKVWHLEERRNDKSLSDTERLAAADQLTMANRQRNLLAQEIDQLLAAVLTGDKTPVVQPYVRVDPGKK